MHLLSIACLLLIQQTDPAPPTATGPQWRGPTSDSMAPSRNLPTHWSKTENIAWKSALPGWGTSTPAIRGDAVFVTTQDNQAPARCCVSIGITARSCGNARSARGRAERKGPVGNGRYHDEHNMATPSPVTDGKHIWVHFGNGDLRLLRFRRQADLVAQPAGKARAVQQRKLNEVR